MSQERNEKLQAEKKMKQKIKNKQTKIIIVSLLGMSNAGGVERVTYCLNEILRSHFDDVQILSRGKISFGKFCNVIWPVLLSLRLFFIKNKIVIANSWNCFLYPADFSIHHGTMKGTSAHVQVGKASRLIAAMEKKSAKKAKKILAVSENCKKELIELYKINESKIEVLNNFVDEKLFFPPSVSASSAGAESNSGAAEKVISESNFVASSEQKINVLFSGALIERKGLSKLKDFSNFIENNNPFSYGDGTSSKKYTVNLLIASNSKNEYGNFENKNHTKIFSGLDVHQMPDFYRNGDILIFPTLYEGFSMATLEALASGVCVLGSDFAVTTELSDFDFCVKSDFSSSEKTVLECIKLYENFKGRKNEIAEKTVLKFGRAAYEKKLVSYVSESLKSLGV